MPGDSAQSDQETDQRDPLEDAEIGERRTVRTEQKFHSINYTPEEFRGLDRECDDYQPVDVELVDDGEMTNWTVTWEGTVEKRERPEWAEEPTEEDTQSLKRKAVSVLAGATPTVAVIVGVSYLLAPAMQGLTINGEPVAAPSPLAMAIDLLTMMFFFAVIFAAIRWAPGRLPGGMFR